MSMRDMLNPAVFSLHRSAIREFTKLASETPGCIKLTLGEPDFNTPSAIIESATDSLRGGDTHYITNSGTMELRDAISGFESENSGLSYTPDEIIVTAGATEGIFISLLGLLEPGDEVIIPQPAFVLYEEIVHLCRGISVWMDTSKDGFQIRPKNLAKHITDRTKAIIINSPNNPTGCIYDQESLETVRDAVCGKNIFVLCDDVYRRLCYTDAYHSFAENNELREQIIEIQSFSKPYSMTGWRMGYLMADRSITERLELIHQFNVVSTPAPFQRACIEALKYDPAPMTGEYKRRRDYVCSRLSDIGLDMVRPDGAFYAFPDISKYKLSSTELCRRLILEAGVAVTPGSAFGSDSHIRISYCCSMDDIKEGLYRMEPFFKKM